MWQNICVASPADVGHGEHDARLVVGQHDSDEAGGGPDGLQHRLREVFHPQVGDI